MKNTRPGSKKGESKPIKRRLDPEFSRRLNVAMKAAGLDVPALARKCGCTRAVLLKYLKAGESKTIEAHLLFEIADQLNVSAQWLLMNGGHMARAVSLDPDQLRLLNLFSLMDEASRATWIEQGEVLHRRQPAMIPTSADPFSASLHHPHKSKV